MELITYYKNYINGDDSAFENILNLTRKSLIFYVNGYVKNVVSAEDIADDVFLKLAIKKPRLNNGTNLKAYLYAMAKNSAVDYLKKQKRISPVPIDECYDQGYTHVENEVLKTEQKRALYSQIQSLKREYQDVIYFIYFEGFDNKACARAMKKTPRQIENLHYRAKQILKQNLKKEELF